jgi:uncharacterized membrane protein (DUF485 family)
MLYIDLFHARVKQPWPANIPEEALMANSSVDWDAMIASEEFRAIARRRRNTIVVLGILSAAYYFSIPALIVWAPEVLKIRLTQGINLGIVFAISQYPFGGIVTYIFMRRTAAIDRATKGTAPLRSRDAGAPEHHHAY